MNPKSPEARSRDDRPFDGLLIDEATSLQAIKTRSPCPCCSKSRMYFCYTCFVPVIDLEGKIPVCRLPVKVDIIKHRKEIDGKSTAAHAAVLAPEDVKIYTYPDVPEYDNDGRTVLLYPGVDAKTVYELFSTDNHSTTYKENRLAELPAGYNVGTLMTKIYHSANNKNNIFHIEKFPISRIILIDSTWNQSRGIFMDEKLRRLPKIVLQSRVSQFWRHQKGSPRWYLSTVEALHQLMMELHLHAWGRASSYICPLTSQYPAHNDHDHPHCQPYTGQYDNLLYFFKYMYEKLHTLYKHQDLLAYKRPMM